MSAPHKLKFRAIVPSLGGAEILGEIEFPAELFQAPAHSEILLTDKQLAERWNTSVRTLRRMRDERKLPYVQPMPGKYLYRLSDVEAHERENEHGTLKAVPKKAAR